MADLYIRRGDNVLGPFNTGKIKQMIAGGKIKKDDLIRGEGQGLEWTTLDEIPNLAKLFGSDNPSTAERKKSSGTDSASSDPQKMFVKRGDAVRGPLTLTAVQNGIAAGKIGRADQIGPRNTGPWKQAGSLLKLFPTNGVVSDGFEGFDDDDVEILDDWEHLADDEQSGNTYRFTPRQTGSQPRERSDESDNFTSPSRRRTKSSETGSNRAMLALMALLSVGLAMGFFLGPAASVLLRDESPADDITNFDNVSNPGGGELVQQQPVPDSVPALASLRVRHPVGNFTDDFTKSQIDVYVGSEQEGGQQYGLFSVRGKYGVNSIRLGPLSQDEMQSLCE